MRKVHLFLAALAAVCLLPAVSEACVGGGVARGVSAVRHRLLHPFANRRAVAVQAPVCAFQVQAPAVIPQQMEKPKAAAPFVKPTLEDRVGDLERRTADAGRALLFAPAYAQAPSVSVAAPSVRVTYSAPVAYRTVYSVPVTTVRVSAPPVTVTRTRQVTRSTGGCTSGTLFGRGWAW